MKTKGIALALVAGALFIACGSRSLTEDLAPALSGGAPDAMASESSLADAGRAPADATGPASPHVVVVRKTGDLSGLVESEPPGINCGATCAAEFASGKLVLQGKDTPTAKFLGWRDGATCAGGAACTLDVARLPSVTFVTADFAPKTKRVTVKVEGRVGNGPAGVVTGLGSACASNCVTDVSLSDTVTLTAAPEFGAAFVEWQGCTTVNGYICTISGPQDAPVTARFVSCELGSDRALRGPRGWDVTSRTWAAVLALCAYRTLAYALTQATHEVYLAAGVYPGGVGGESLGYVLAGNQHIVGDNTDASKVVFRPSYFQGTTSLRFTGANNGVSHCTFEGPTGQGLMAIEVEPIAQQAPYTIIGNIFYGLSIGRVGPRR